MKTKRNAPIPARPSPPGRYTGAHRHYRPTNGSRQHRDHKDSIEESSAQVIVERVGNMQCKTQDTPQGQRGTSFLPSESDNAMRRSTPMLPGDCSEASWQFESGNQTPRQLSSPNLGSDQLHYTTSVPGIVSTEIGQKSVRSVFDFSETASTMLRSSPAGPGDSTQDVFEFFNRASSPSSALEDSQQVAARRRRKQSPKHSKKTAIDAIPESGQVPDSADEKAQVTFPSIVPISPHVQVSEHDASSAQASKVSTAPRPKSRQGAKPILKLDGDDRVLEAELESKNSKSMVPRKRGRRANATSKACAKSATALSKSINLPKPAAACPTGQRANKTPRVVTRAQVAKATKSALEVKDGVSDVVTSMKTTTASQAQKTKGNDYVEGDENQRCQAMPIPSVPPVPQELGHHTAVTTSDGSRFSSPKPIRRRLFAEATSSPSACQSLDLAADMSVYPEPPVGDSSHLFLANQNSNGTFLGSFDPSGRSPSMMKRRIADRRASLNMKPIARTSAELPEKCDELAATQNRQSLCISSNGSPIRRKSPLPCNLTNAVPDLSRVNRQQLAPPAAARLPQVKAGGYFNGQRETAKLTLSSMGDRPMGVVTGSDDSLLNDLRAHFTDKNKNEGAREGPKASEKLLSGQEAGSKLVEAYEARVNGCIGKIQVRHDMERDVAFQKMRVDQQRFVTTTQRALQQVSNRSARVEKQMQLLDDGMKARRSVYRRSVEALEALRQDFLNEAGMVDGEDFVRP
ncbi:hypothetical protein CDD82_5759 [Ophiocordyceps australis]|uniref:Uncharacterized protein n=1 Tax=Ophiocordyceps australis TaxID=1399860 RepID=A0A2C5ZKJ0_9HYPO|nr:hypothetical protein CDD82_5759 [Ophiocordyceps australis]